MPIINLFHLHNSLTEEKDLLGHVKKRGYQFQEVNVTLANQGEGNVELGSTSQSSHSFPPVLHTSLSFTPQKSFVLLPPASHSSLSRPRTSVLHLSLFFPLNTFNLLAPLLLLYFTSSSPWSNPSLWLSIPTYLLVSSPALISRMFSESQIFCYLRDFLKEGVVYNPFQFLIHFQLLTPWQKLLKINYFLPFFLSFLLLVLTFTKY